jgi:undecaprenyl-diphosphatase
MNFISIIVLGVVEGLTEFLPISSTFHLIQTARILQIPQEGFVKLFEVAIQSGAVFAIFFLFKKEIWFTKRLYLKILISTIPALIAGFLLHDIIKNVFFESNQLMIFAFIVVGVIFILVEWFVSKHTWRISRGLLDVSYIDALLIGLIQVLALVPGVSRSGSVIVGLLLLNYRRDDAATYSLALSVPVIFAATGYDLFKNRDLLLSGSGENFMFLVVGFILSFIVGYFAARWLVAYLQKHTLRLFGIYRIALGILLLVFGAIR